MTKFINNKNWDDFFKLENIKNEIDNIFKSINISSNKNIFPEQKNIFRCFNETSPNNIQIVLLGEDPYHNRNKNGDPVATGLCFHLENQTKINPSLKNIYKELERSGFSINKKNGNLLKWTKFCLMLNSALTVEEGKAGSHSKIWKNFTVSLIEYIDNNLDNITFLLLGNKAQYFSKYIKKSKILLATHPSPFSANRKSKSAPAFIGSDIFKETLINWDI